MKETAKKLSFLAVTIIILIPLSPHKIYAQVVPAAGCLTNADCNDGNVCTNDVCTGAVAARMLRGTCVHSAVSCSDAFSCTTDSCNPATGCVHTPDDTKCEDGNVCTDNTCDPAAPDAVNGCVVAYNDGVACNDGKACTTNDRCLSGTCQPGTPNDALCDDANPCTDNACDPAVGCVTSYNTNTCDADLNACTGIDRCVDGTCVGGTPVNCDDGIACTDDSCDPADGSCNFTPVNSRCDDANACNGVEACIIGRGCVAGPPVNCDDGNACTTDSCDPASGACSHAPIRCDDGNACNGVETCDRDIGCRPGVAPLCADDVRCTEDGCDPASGCYHRTKDERCDDGDSCTTDTCDAVLGCQARPIPGCTPPAPGGGCKADKECDNGIFCDGAETCDVASGKCLAGSPPSCDDGNSCTMDSCPAELNHCQNFPIADCHHCPDNPALDWHSAWLIPGNDVNADGIPDFGVKKDAAGHLTIDQTQICEMFCGNGVIDGEEQCDDGNTFSSDGCDNKCRLECGNGKVDEVEECDDGNLVNGDGCSDKCILESPAPVATPDSCVKLGYPVGSRENYCCQQGLTAGTMGWTCCTRDLVDPGSPAFDCCVDKAKCPAPAPAGAEKPLCGNGISGETDPATGKTEFCDPPGSSVTVDKETCTCDPGCMGFTCAAASPPPTCGNGVIDKGEECDPKDPKTAENCDPATCTVKKAAGGTPSGGEKTGTAEKCVTEKSARDAAFTKWESGEDPEGAAFFAAAQTYCDCTGVQTPLCKPHTCPSCEGITDPTLKACCERHGGLTMAALEECCQDGTASDECCRLSVGGLPEGSATETSLDLCCRVVNSAGSSPTLGGLQQCLDGESGVTDDPCTAYFKAFGEMPPACLTKCQQNPSDPACTTTTGPQGTVALTKYTGSCEPANPADKTPDGRIWGITAKGTPTPLKLTCRSQSQEGILAITTAHNVSFRQTRGRLVSDPETPGQPGESGTEVKTPKLVKSLMGSAGEASVTLRAPPLKMTSTGDQTVGFACDGTDPAGRLIGQSDEFVCPVFAMVQGGGCKGCVVGAGSSFDDSVGNLAIGLFILSLPFIFRRRIIKIRIDTSR